MRKKGKQWMRRTVALFLAVLLAVGMIPGNVLETLAEDPLIVIFKYTGTDDFGTALDDNDEVKISITGPESIDKATTKAELCGTGTTISLSTAGEYNYTISSAAYGKSLVGSFTVSETNDSLNPVEEDLDIGLGNVGGQFTEVALSGVVEDAEGNPISDVTVKASYDSADGVEAFSTNTDQYGMYSGQVKINSTVVLALDSTEYVADTQKIVIGTSAVQQNISVKMYTVTVQGKDPNIIDSITIDGEPVETNQVYNGRGCEIVIKEKSGVAGRYTLAAKVGEQICNQQYNEADGTYTITLNAQNTDTIVALSFTTKLNIENLKSTTKNTQWSKTTAEITGTVTGAENNFEVSLESVEAGVVAPTDKKTDKNFSFQFNCQDNTSIAQQYRVVLKDTLTSLEKRFDLATGEGVYIDKIKPTIGEVQIPKDGWFDDGSRNWAKDGATYTVSMSDAESGIDESSISVANSNENENDINYSNGTATVTVEAKSMTNGSVTDTIKVRDKAVNEDDPTDNGNEAIKRFTYGIDSQAPKVTGSGLDDMDGIVKNDSIYYWNGETPFNITFDADDNEGSGAASYIYRIEGTGNTDIQSGTSDQDTTWDGKKGSIAVKPISNEGSYTVYVKAKDNLGNESEETEIAKFTVDNTVPTISYKFELEENLITKFLGLFGIYFNSDLTVIVTATDNGAGFLENSTENLFGTLSFNDNETIEADNVTVISASEAKATYTLSLNEDKAIRSIVTLSSVTDILGNKSENIIATMGKDANSNLSNLSENTDIQILLEQDNPTWSIDKSVEGKTYIENCSTDLGNNRTWYAADATASYVFNIEDPETEDKQASGLYDIVCKVNGDEIEDSKLTVTLTDNGKLGVDSLSDSQKNLAKKAEASITLNENDSEKSSGACKLELYVIDNAGNISETYTDTIYFDVDAPKINSFKFNPVDVDGKESTNDLAAAIQTDYGYFFNESTTVEVNVTDYIKETQTEGSGVKLVEYQLIPAGGSPSEWKAATSAGADNYKFTVAEGFKGQVCVRAMDNVEQTTDGYKEGSTGVSPNKVVLEAQKTHDKNTSASITLNNTQYRDAKGNRLYTGTINATVLAQNTFAGIKSVTYDRVDGTNGTSQHSTFIRNLESSAGTVTGVLAINGTENNIATRVGATDTINYGSNVEVSDITLDMSMTCNSNHTNTVRRQTVSYDTWAPRLEITWDNNDVRNGKYYNQDRTATIVVTERNFDESACEFITTGPSPSISGWSHNGDVHTATVTFSADGDYTFTFRTTDRAGHTTAYDRTDEFVIDQTNPVISVVYDNNNAQNGYYYQDARIATITITEHNFSGADVVTSMTANDNGTGIATPSVNGWSSGNDANVATISYNYDGEFTFGMNYTDLAGNPAEAYGEDHFVIDLTDPELEIYDIVDKSANNGEVAPGVRYYDTNVDGDGVTIELTGANNGAYSLDGSRSVSANGVDLKLNDFPYEKEIDDLYTMRAYVEDLSGRSAEQTVMFSVNRFGSVYVLDDDTKKLVEENDGYTNKEQMVGIREINVDLLETSDISVSREGDLKKLKAEEDYKVKRSGSENTWKEYYYQLDKENFEEEGAYNVTVFSTDRAANSQDNKNNKREEACNVEFVIDKTAPSTVVTGIEDGGRYREVEKEVHIDSKDNIRLAKVVVEIDGQVTEYDSNEISGSSGAIDLVIGSADKWQNVKIYSVDKAGNTDEEDQTTGSMRVIVTSNLWVQFINNTPLLVGVIALLVCVAGGCIWFFIFAKRKKEAVQ